MDRARAGVVAVLLGCTLVLSLVSHRWGVGALFLAAAFSVALVINLRDARVIAVEYLWRWTSRRRPDLSEARLNAYVIGWAIVLIIAFLIVLLRILAGNY